MEAIAILSLVEHLWLTGPAELHKIPPGPDLTRFINSCIVSNIRMEICF